jgi:hypothetical protein
MLRSATCKGDFIAKQVLTCAAGDKGDVEDITEADIISTVEFDHTGNYLATGDKGGRVVLFERNETVSILFRGRPESSLTDFCRRRRRANINSIPNSNPTSRNLTTSNR